MKKAKQYFLHAKEHFGSNPENYDIDLLWNLICYSPKYPARLHQQQLIDEAEKLELTVYDDHFSKGELKIQVYKWGNGSKKILLTHGWASKAADFTELITLLKEKDARVISFDAPGNGASEGELSNLLLYVLSVRAVVQKFGVPDVMIGHSLGAMANIQFLKDAGITIPQLISLTPVIKLKENFIFTMTNAGVPETAQNAFFDSFIQLFGVPASDFDLNKLYNPSSAAKHLLIYDEDDKVSPAVYIHDFLDAHPEVTSSRYDGAGHEKMHREVGVLAEIDSLIHE